MNAADENQEFAETEIRGLLHDRSECAYPYTLTINRESHDWHVFDSSRRIGYAWCLLHGDEFKIGDLKLEQAVTQPRTFWERLWRRSPDVRNYRRRGLGSCLLLLIIQHARGQGARKITGLVSSKDLAEFPTLVTWYSRFGFTFTSTTPNSRIVGQIELVL